MTAQLEAYVGIAVFEVGKADGSGSYFREDIYLVRAPDLTEATQKVESLATAQEIETGPTFVRLRNIVDVAPTLYGIDGESVDLYSRHFANLDDYASFEMRLGGPDPLAS